MRPTSRTRGACAWAAAVLGLTILAFGPPFGPARVWAEEAPAQPAPAEPVEPAEPPPATPAAEPANPAEPAPAPPAAEPAAPAIPVPAPGTPIALNFKDASLRTVLEYLSGAAGLIVVEDAKVEGRVTVMSLQSISVEEAVSLLDTVLRQKGYAAIRIGRTLKIVTIDQAKKELVPVRSGNDPEQIQPSDRIVTHIIPVRYADAVKLKADLASLFPATTDVASNAASNTLIVTGTEATVRRMVEIIQAIDVHMSDVTQVKVFALKYANATNAARLIADIFKPDQAQGPTVSFGGRRTFTLPGAQSAAGSQETGQRPSKVTASADERTNTLVVSAAPDVMKVIEGVVKDLDANPAEEQAVFIYRLKNAKAANVESVLNGIFGWTGTSPSATSAAQRTTGTAFGTSGFTGGSAFGSRTGTRGLGSTSMGAGQTGRTGTTRSTASRPSGRGLSSAASAAASDLAGQVFVVADEDTNSVVVTTATKNFERVRAIILDLDRAVPQVLIKVLIAEVSHDKSLDLGAEFSLMNLRASGRGVSGGTDFSAAADFAGGDNPGGFLFKLEEKEVTAAIRALAKTAKLDVLSRPYILTSDNQQASIMVGQEVPFITNTRTTDTGQTINTIEYDDIGIILNVTPHINPQGLVTMDVYPEISTLTGQTVPISETVDAPVFAKRFAQSRVAIRDGQTIVIGGLMEDRNTTSVRKVPLLGDIPLLGALFRRTVEAKTKTELLIFLTPHVAQEPDELKSMSESEKAGAKIIPDAVEKGAFEEHLKGMERGAAPPRPPAEEGLTTIPPAEKEAPTPPPDEPRAPEP